MADTPIDAPQPRVPTSGVGRTRVTIDGNEAAVRVAHRVSEVIAIYPITPASPMGELADAWSQAGRTNLWGAVPQVVEMQSEGGAAGTVHGALSAGALTTTFTASQGLLLMIPNLYKLAGELTPAVIHVAARSVATHALSIFGDHSDVMAVRQTGMAMLCSASVQEAQDLACIAHAATLATRVPFVHFFDGFRTSHEVNTIVALDDADLRAMIDDDLVDRHREHGLWPDHPVLRGTAQNPDVFFQAREAANPFHDAVPEVVQAQMDRFADLTGRHYQLVTYHGAPDAERVVVLMGSGVAAAKTAVDELVAAGQSVGVVAVHLYRPFPTEALVAAFPTTVRRVAVLDRTKEPGSVGEPLHLDVTAALAHGGAHEGVRVIGGRYGLSSKEFTPPMVMAVFDELSREAPRQRITVGIVDDVTGLSVEVDPDRWHEPDDVVRAVFFGLGSDGTVGANKHSVKIIGEQAGRFAQGHFVYDSRKSGTTTVSHLRFGPNPIDAPYLVRDAQFVGCHHLGTLDRLDVLGVAAPGATLLFNSPFGDRTWDRLPAEVQHTIVDRGLQVWVVDAGRVAAQAGIPGRTNAVLQTCFFRLSGVLPPEEAIAAIKDSIAVAYAKAGPLVLERNYAAVDAALAGLSRLEPPREVTAARHLPPPVSVDAPEFVQRVTARIIAGEGDLLPVSALPVDGTFPTGTTRWEKRSIATEIPIWDPDICIDCGRCALVCPHAAIRMKVSTPDDLVGAPDGYRSKPFVPHKTLTGTAPPPDRDEPWRLTIQVAPDDCTGCGVCVSVCPAKSKEMVKHRAINMEPKDPHLDVERAGFDWFVSLPEHPRTDLNLDSVAGSQLAQPLFEFSGACAGCGETPYLKLVSQLFGDRMVVANATGCSSIYGANLPATPWAADTKGRGPAWANSLFEDNAEFGLGMRLALDHHEAVAHHLLTELAATSAASGSASGRDARLVELAAELASNDQRTEAAIAAQRAGVGELVALLADHPSPLAQRLTTLAPHLVRASMWIIGGDGWAYDIGFGGLDHVLASGRDVNILVLDTEVYSNTGGQTSKSTPRAAVAKFSSGGKRTAKKDLGMIAMSYGDVYVAQVAMGANMTQVVKALHEAEAHPGPSLVIAYSPCIAHGIDMSDMIGHQRMATAAGYWPLYRFDPAREAAGEHALHLDSRAPTVPFAEFARTEGRFAMLSRSDPQAAERLFAAAQRDIDNRWHLYEQMVEVERTATYSELAAHPHLEA